MSRVDEALRRVAEQAAADANGPMSVNGAAAGLVDVFPDEVAPAPRPAPRELNPPAPPTDPSLVIDAASTGADAEVEGDAAAEEPRAGRSRRRSQGSIFDHIDSRL